MRVCLCVCIHMYMYIYYEWYFIVCATQPQKQNEILPFTTTCMDLEGIMLSEINQTEKDKYCMISLICGI